MTAPVRHIHSGDCTAFCADGYETCPEHGNTLGYHPDQGDDEYERREHLECTVPDCRYEVWA